MLDSLTPTKIAYTTPPAADLIRRPRSAKEISTLRENCWRLAKVLVQQRDELLRILTRIATRDAAEDEFNRSVRILLGASWEIAQSDPPKIDRLSVFLPSNNVLYSYVLFGLVPSLYCGEVTIRPSSRTRDAALAVHEALKRPSGHLHAGRIHLTDVSQRTFATSCADADALVFTGRYENGLKVMEQVGERPLFLLFGSGPNPLVVGPEADLKATRRALLGARLYNSGQDCLCTDMIFVHHSRVDQLLDALTTDLRGVTVHDRRSPGAVVAPLVYPDAVEAAERYVKDHADRVVLGGHVDTDRLVVSPSVVMHPSIEGLHPPEFFSPIFSLVPYHDVTDILRWAHSPLEMERGMYAMVFGEPALTGPRLGSAAILREMTTFDHEDGNKPFGGFGVQAGGVRTADGSLTGRPLLLSAELTRRAPR